MSAEKIETVDAVETKGSKASRRAAKNKKEPSPARRFWFEVLSLWFMNEVVFTVLPIVVILLIDIAFSNRIENVLLLPEWSFAAIVLYGIAISNSIEMKAQYNDELTPRLLTGTKAMTILLIGAVITLTLAILREKSVDINAMFIQSSQVVLFVHALFSVFIGVFTRQEYNWLPERYPEHFTDKELMQYIVHLTKEADGQLGRLRFAIEKTGFNSSKIHPRDEAYFWFFIDEIEKSIGQIKRSWTPADGTRPAIPPYDQPQLPPIHEAKREVRA